MAKKLYVGNLSYETTDSALEQMFAVIPSIEFGFVRCIDIHRGQQHSLSGERH